MNHHLGRRVGAVADGQLDPRELERHLAHAASCPSCRASLDAQREARAAVTAVVEPAPSADLTAKLLAMGAGFGSLGPTSGAGRGAPPGIPASWLGPAETGGRPVGPPARLPDALPGTTGPETSGPVEIPAAWLEREAPRRPRWHAAGAVGGVGVVAALGLFAIGSHPGVAPPAVETVFASAPTLPGQQDVAAQADSVLSETVGTGERDTTRAALDWIEDQGWRCPRALPAGFEIADVRLVQGVEAVLEVVLNAPGGQAVVTEQVGVLDEDALVGYDVLHVHGRDIHVLQADTLQATWQDGDQVVTVVTDVSRQEITRLVAGFPLRTYDDSPPARIARGWQAVTGALS